MSGTGPTPQDGSSAGPIPYRDGQASHDTVGTIEPHTYWPSYQHMGDCAICGHVAESPLHVDPPRPRRDLLDV